MSHQQCRHFQIGDGLHSWCRRGERVGSYTYGSDTDLGTLRCAEILLDWMLQQAINIVVSARPVDGKVWVND